MNPILEKPSEDDDVYSFTLKNINVSLANAIRRTILSDIPTLVFYTETYADNKCSIEINTTRLHNELLKQRLSCIPIHEKDLDILPGKYVLEVDVKNDTDNMMYVTTEHFRIKNKESGVYAKAEESRRIFPSNPKTKNSYIDLVRLRPKISDSIPGEHLKLQAEFSVSTAKVNSMFNVVSKCTYSNTMDMVRINELWGEYENKLRSEEATADEIEFQKRNFYMLDAQRHFVPDSFDFIIQTIGVYDNKEIVKMACSVIQNKFVDLISAIDSDIVTIIGSESAAEPSIMDNSYDVILENEDYTLGKVIEYILYETHYMGDKTLSYCGFKKFHPHSSDSTIRMAFTDPADKTEVRKYLRKVCVEAQEVFKNVYKMF
jgi:DNA-directed RNA polymerase subunit L